MSITETQLAGVLVVMLGHIGWAHSPSHGTFHTHFEMFWRENEWYSLI